MLGSMKWPIYMPHRGSLIQVYRSCVCILECQFFFRNKGKKMVVAKTGNDVHICTVTRLCIIISMQCIMHHLYANKLKELVYCSIQNTGTT